MKGVAELLKDIHGDTAESPCPVDHESEFAYGQTDDSDAAEWDKYAKVVRQQLHKMNMEFTEQEDEDGVVFRGDMRVDYDNIGDVQFSIGVDGFCAESFFSLPIRATRERFGALAEFCARVNYPMSFGALVVDYVHGGIMFKMCLSPAAVIAKPKEAVEHLVKWPVNMIETYASGVNAVLQGENPHRAYKKCDPDSSYNVEDDDEEVNPMMDTVTAGNGSPEPKPKMCCEPSSAYSLEGLNVAGDIQLCKIVEAVRKFCKVRSSGDEAPRLNILLSGPSGCGKTEFVKYLGREVGVAVMTISASDVLRTRVGDTEQKLAQVFRKARESKRILFFDEVDSFLSSRANADQLWAVTQVNELLQQMDRFEGIVIGATNFAENLDRAVLRRFTYKLKFDYLTETGKDVFYRRYFGGGLSLSEKTRLATIEKLTPGDFRTVREKLFYLSDRQTNTERLAALEAESAAKGRDHACIGFSSIYTSGI